MKKLCWLLRVVGILQITLGLLYLLAPSLLLQNMGHSVPEADLFYPLSMLAARFIAYGGALLIIAKEPAQHRLWILTMIVIQIIDLAAGIFYTATGVIPITLSGFPMFNAAWIIALLILWLPKHNKDQNKGPEANPA